ncbi:adenosylcobinamide-phosphate synthase CbiB [Polymorphum gilvum]|uniref:Cobalamin biosynthesis protein CobD n=1 Tax=Polymorphum gilvum (strain LMG 25793 / CGMCC 1.9160 / SL003B-26A1) TaxID=991905 RepID=F2IXE3_POLGS|nr:adenosylcobinamide-phosphate synthase CbiB [Polymorphum gilvum]ADZ70461.1 Cobalamin biosynthesis protein, adenosylcobinamide-phosphate synthase protein [Polymorphum gilvum SL003B-26A1]
MLLFPDCLWLLLLALVLDGLIGDPAPLWRRLPHPVTWIAAGIGLCDRHLNKEAMTPERRRAAGVATLVLLVGMSLILGWIVQAMLSAMTYGWILIGLIASVLIAQKSLYQHVAAVAAGLTRDGLASGRRAVAMIVGRDPERLDEAGVARAAIESAAENFSDGVVAPALWFALLGLPGLVAYKAVNTADSMIGHKTDRHRDFGWAAARFDDLVNLPASRLSGLLIALVAPIAGGSATAALASVRRDAAKHRSPNAGWPEAAMAGALGIALAGPRAYAGYTVDDPFLNAAGRRDLTARDIHRALATMAGACVLLALLVLIAATGFTLAATVPSA